MRTDYDRIKFFSQEDMSTAWHLERIDDSLQYLNSVVELSLNDIIEYYNISKFIDNNCFLPNWDDNKIQKLLGINKDIKSKLGRYFSAFNIKNPNISYSKLYFEYIEDFWELFSIYKAYKTTSSDDFIAFIQNNNVYPGFILKEKDIVQYYDDELSKLYYDSYEIAELIIKDKLEQRDVGCKYNFPSKINIEKIIENYINSNEANSNHLNAIANEGKTGLHLDDRILYNARRKYVELVSDKSKFGTHFEYGVGLCFSENQKEPISISYENFDILYSYSKSFILRSMDPYDLLINNFEYVFKFIDNQSRLKLVHHYNTANVIERIIGTRTKNEYFIDTKFTYNQMSSDLQTVYYSKLLEDNNVFIEDLIYWYFNIYIKSKYNIDNFVFIKSTSQTYLEKCQHIIGEIDRVLKQYKAYVNDGYIDKDLISFSSTPVIFEEIPSILRNKYVYPVEGEYNGVTNLLFSDQSGLTYLYKTNKSYKSFYELLLNENLKLDDFHPYQQQQINLLIENSYCYIDANDLIKPDIGICNTLYDLYTNDVISYAYLMTKNNINEAMNRKLCSIGSNTLFSIPESDYLSYLLNNRKFSNGPDLRNKYAHGNIVNLSEEENERNYYIFIKILIIIILKINSELIIKDIIEEKAKNEKK